MARPRTFAQDEVLERAAQAFTAGGYEGTSIDDLVRALGLHRGSLYKAFGSKRGLFLAVLEEYVRSGIPDAVRAAMNGTGDVVEELTAGNDLDLLMIAAIERGHSDPQVAALVRRALTELAVLAGRGGPLAEISEEEGQATAILGARLRRRLLSEREDQKLPKHDEREDH